MRRLPTIPTMHNNRQGSGKQPRSEERVQADVDTRPTHSLTNLGPARGGERGARDAGGARASEERGCHAVHRAVERAAIMRRGTMRSCRVKQAEANRAQSRQSDGARRSTHTQAPDTANGWPPHTSRQTTQNGQRGRVHRIAMATEQRAHMFHCTGLVIALSAWLLARAICTM